MIFRRQPFCWIVVFWAAGILLAEVPLPAAPVRSLFGWPFSAILAGFAGALGIVAGLLLLWGKRVPLWLVGTLLVCGSLLYAAFSKAVPPDHISRKIWGTRARTMTVEGVVAGEVRQSSRGRGAKVSFILELERCDVLGMRSCSGKLLVNVFSRCAVSEADRLRLTGTLHRPFEFDPTGRFSYERYLQGKGIGFILSVGKKGSVQELGLDERRRVLREIARLRENWGKVFSKYLDPQEAGLMKALLLGERYDIAREIKDLFVVTGTAHILAVSGFNVGIVAFLVFLTLKVLRCPRRTQYVLTILFLIFYALLTGGQAPVVRATIMGVVFFLGFLIERRHDPLNTLAFAAWLILLWDPRELYSVGFQLSFASVLFILVLYPRLMMLFSGIAEWFSLIPARALARVADFLLRSLSVSLAAWWGVLGLIAYYFLMVTPVTILANLIVVPLVSVLTALGVGLLVFDALLPAGAAYWANCISLLLSGLVKTVYAASLLPGGYYYLRNVSAWQVGVYYLLWLFWFWGKRRFAQPPIDPSTALRVNPERESKD